MLRGFIETPAFVRLSVVVYAVGFSYYSAVRYLGLQTTAWDMGIYNQALFTTLFAGRLFYYTPDLPANPTGSLFGIHFSPILLTLSPFYLLYPSPITLLVVQAAVLGLGALPLYYYTLDKFGEKRTALTFALAYLVSPLIVGINWYDFHPEMFIPPALLGAIYFWTKRKWFGYFACVVAALSSIETAPVIVGALGLYFAWKERLKLMQVRRLRDLTVSPVFVPLSTIAISAGWLVVALSVIRSLNPINVFYYGKSPLFWTVLGARNIGEVPIRAFVDPASALSALAYEWWLKGIYLVLLFAPLVFLPLRSRSLSLLTLPWLGVALLSNYLPFYVVGFQYTAFVASFIFIGGAEGLAKLGKSGRHLGLSAEGLKRGIVVAALIAFIVGTPTIYWFSGLLPPAPPYHLFSAGSHESAVRDLVSMIPPSASVMTQPNIFPLVSSRANAYVVPTVSLFPPGTSFNATFDQWLNASEYVLLDPVTDQISSLLTLHRLRTLAVHGLFAQVQDIILFRKSYTGLPVRYEPRIVVLDWRTLELLNTRLVSDPKSISGNVLYHGLVSSSPFWDSAQIWLPAGTYQAVLRVRTDSSPSELLFGVDITTYSVTALTTPIGDQQTGFNYKFALRSVVENVSSTRFNSTEETSNSYREFTISFKANGMQSFSFRGEALTKLTGIYLDTIRVEQLDTFVLM